jgi:prepilin-type N-terminal cleavage/methylation domain-containing protein
MSNSSRSGMTLIEVIMALAVIGIAFYTLIAIYITLAPRDIRIENINTKLYLAQEKTEEYLPRNFGQIVSVNPTTFESASFRNYNYQIAVTYVATSDVNTAVAGPTPFKNVKVRVWGGPIDKTASVEITTLVATYDVH